MAIISDQDRVFPLGGEAPISGNYGPAIREKLDETLAGIDHGFNGEAHAGTQHQSLAGLAVMQYLGFLMEITAYAMTTVFLYYGKAMTLNMALNGMANITQVLSRFYFFDSPPHGFISYFT